MSFFLSVISSTKAHASDDLLPGDAFTYKQYCGDFRPTSGTFLATRAASEFRVTWNFRLDENALNALKCVSSVFGQHWLELDLVLTGFAGVKDWDAYDITGTNIPGAVHDSGWMDEAQNAVPGVTGIPVSALAANTAYYVSIRWNTTGEFYPAPGQTQRVSFQWVPSHWANKFNASEGPACAIGLGLKAWCIFPGATAYISGRYYDFFSSRDGIPFGNPLSPPYPFPPGSGGSGSHADSPSTGGGTPDVSSTPPPSRQLFLRGDSAMFGKDDLGYGNWIQQTDPGSVKAIAAGGKYQMVLNACNAVYAKETLGMGGWTQETPCGGANKIAVSSTGLQMLIDACGAVWAKYGIGMGGWTQEVGCGNADAIAVGGNNQLFLRGDKAVFWRSGVGTDWHMQVGPLNAVAIAADNTGMFAFARHDGALFAKRGHYGDGGWQMQAGPGNTYDIAAGGGILAFKRGDGAVFAKTNIAVEGQWQQQADPGTVNLLDVGDNGRIMIRSNTNAVYAKDNLVNGDWRLQIGDGNAVAIAVG